MDKFVFFALNIIVNSVCMLLTTFLIVEALIALFRIQPGRTASYLRAIPLLKLAIDPFLYDFSNWSYAQGVNPLNCEEGSRILGIFIGSPCFKGWFPLLFTSETRMTTSDGFTFTLADLLGYILPFPFLLGLTLFVTLVSFYLLVRQIYLYTAAWKELKGLGKALLNSRKIIHPKLLIHDSSIVITDKIKGSPFVAGLWSSTIFIPSCLSKKLTQKEYEAMIAHEMGHIYYKDNLFKSILEVISAIFWWIPTKKLRNRIEEGLEIGCDVHCQKYGFSPEDLASAIYKSILYQSQRTPLLYSHNLARKCSIQRRVKILLSSSKRYTKFYLLFSSCAFCIAFFGILLGRYWIF